MYISERLMYICLTTIVAVLLLLTWILQRTEDTETIILLLLGFIIGRALGFSKDDIKNKIFFFKKKVPRSP
jgi:hypothetical protein